MKSTLVIRTALVWITAAVPALALAACGNEPEEAPPAQVQEFEFAGTVQAVDSTRRMVTVQNEDIPGWMSPMAMSYQLNPAGVLDSLQVGDRITATVRSGDFSTLYGVEVVRP
jgi:Cu/Ag efflux protein CusF